MDECLFCKIIRKEIPANFVHESENLVVFPDIHPSADLHFLVVPKKHIKGMEEIKEDHGPLLVEVFQTVDKLISENNLRDGFYRVVTNGARARHVDHLHFHLLGGNWKKMV